MPSYTRRRYHCGTRVPSQYYRISARLKRDQEHLLPREVSSERSLGMAQHARQSDGRHVPCRAAARQKGTHGIRVNVIINRAVPVSHASAARAPCSTARRSSLCTALCKACLGLPVLHHMSSALVFRTLYAKCPHYPVLCMQSALIIQDFICKVSLLFRGLYAKFPYSLGVYMQSVLII